jgi:hypothetical protein
MNAENRSMMGQTILDMPGPGQSYFPGAGTMRYGTFWWLNIALFHRDRRAHWPKNAQRRQA